MKTNEATLVTTHWRHRQLTSRDQLGLPAICWKWLVDPASLTRRLRHLTRGQIQLSFQHVDWALPFEDEYEILEVAADESVWVREINWRYEQQNWVFTRAAIPQTTLAQNNGLLAQAGERSIGDILLTDPHLKRTAFELCRLPDTHPYYHSIGKLEQKSDIDLWARRSIFIFFDHPLLVTEIFLPAIFDFLQQRIHPHHRAHS